MYHTGIFLGWLSIATKASIHPIHKQMTTIIARYKANENEDTVQLVQLHIITLCTWPIPGKSLAASNKTSPGSWYCETKIDELDEVQIIFCLLGLISVFLFVFLSICAIFPACWFVVEVIVAPNRESPRSQRTADRIADMTPRFRKGCSGELVGHWFVSSIIKSPWWC